MYAYYYCKRRIVQCKQQSQNRTMCIHKNRFILCHFFFFFLSHSYFIDSFSVYVRVIHTSCGCCCCCALQTKVWLYDFNSQLNSASVRVRVYYFIIIIFVCHLPTRLLYVHILSSVSRTFLLSSYARARMIMTAFLFASINRHPHCTIVCAYNENETVKMTNKMGNGRESNTNRVHIRWR